MTAKSLHVRIGLENRAAKINRRLPTESMKLTLLGTGTPNADPTRSGPAVAIVVDSNTYIVDAGAGIGEIPADRGDRSAGRHGIA